MPEDAPSAPDLTNTRAARNASSLATTKNPLMAPIKGMNSTKNSNKMMMTFLNSNVNADSRMDIDRVAKQADQPIGDDEKTNKFQLRSGSVKVDKSCLSCNGVPSHTMKMFKLACLSYKPSPV